MKPFDRRFSASKMDALFVLPQLLIFNINEMLYLDMPKSPLIVNNGEPHFSTIRLVAKKGDIG